jgi:hypothetical protein
VRAKGVVRKWRFTPQTCPSRGNARETTLDLLRNTRPSNPHAIHTNSRYMRDIANHRHCALFPSTEGEKAPLFTPQTCPSRGNARETLLEKLRFRYFSAGFRARKGFSPANAPQ